MKKSLFAIAAVTAFAGAAQAQSSVSVYGIMDIGVIQSTDAVSATTGVQTTTKQLNTGYGKGGMASSRLGFRGTEDVGGGTSVGFVLEYGLKDIGIGGTGGQQASSTSADASTSTANAAGMIDPRQSFVSLANKGFGQIRLGRQAQSIHGVIIDGSVGGGNNVAGTIYSGGENGAANNSSIRPELVWVNRAVTYISPSFNGATLEVQTGNQTISSGTVSVADSAATDVGASLRFVQGPLKLGVGYSTVQLNASPTTGYNKLQFMAASGSYDFKVVQAFALYSQSKKENGAGGNLGTLGAIELGLKAPVAKNINVFASGFKGNRSSNQTAATAVTQNFATYTAMGEADVKGYQLGAQYVLSKRSSLYAVGGSQGVDGKNSSNGIRNKTSAAIVGITHTF
jgi:predicted porin